MEEGGDPALPGVEEPLPLSLPVPTSPSKKTKLGKPLSRSQDNLASVLRKKAIEKRVQANKENLKDRANSPKFKVPAAKSPMRKAHSTQSIDKTGGAMKRAQSAHNITKSQSTQALSSQGAKGAAVKRAASSYNMTQVKPMIKSSRGHDNKSSANVLACNAELLGKFEKDKKTYEMRISELTQVASQRKKEVEKLKFEVKHLEKKVPSTEMTEELHTLRNENELLKSKLTACGLSVEHCTDTEKLLRSDATRDTSVTRETSVCSGRRHDWNSDYVECEHNSQLGVSLDNLSQGISEVQIDPPQPFTDADCSSRPLGAAPTLGVTPPQQETDADNWDKQSNKSSEATSEVSVANLQDRILQMEETHYSTNEELQATLQELSDLQDSYNDLSDECEALNYEKQVLLESLCTQTEKLENCRRQIESMKPLLLSDSGRGDRSANEKQFVALLKAAQEEKEELKLMQQEYVKTVQTLDSDVRELQDVIQALRDKSHIQESKVDAITSEKRALEDELAAVKSQASKDTLEMNRLKTLLQNEKENINRLGQVQNAGDRSELENLLSNVQKEKDSLQITLTNVQKNLAMKVNEIIELKEKMSSQDEEVKVLRNNGKSAIKDLEYKMSRVEEEKITLQSEVDSLRDHIDQLQIDCDRYLEEKKTHCSQVTKLEAQLKKIQLKNAESQNEIKELRNKYSMKEEEWVEFQKDLQTAVVIANNFKSEMQVEFEQKTNENISLKEQVLYLQGDIASLHDQIHKLQHEAPHYAQELRGKVMNTVDRELLVLRMKSNGGKVERQNSLSVKNIIQSIEEHVKTPNTPTSPIPFAQMDSSRTNFSPTSPTICPMESSRRNSSDSSASFKSDTSPKHEMFRRTSVPVDPHLKSVLRKSDVTVSKDSRSPSHRHTYTDGMTESPAAESDKHITSILKDRRTSLGDTKGKTDGFSSSHAPHIDPLSHLAKLMGGSKRNALLKWCQQRVAPYSEVEVTNFSSSWNDGLAFCALMHSYSPELVPYQTLDTKDKLNNFTTAFKAAESLGIPQTLNVSDMVAMERPDWQAVMNYVTNIYKHFEIDK